VESKQNEEQISYSKIRLIFLFYFYFESETEIVHEVLNRTIKATENEEALS